MAFLTRSRLLRTPSLLHSHHGIYSRFAPFCTENTPESPSPSTPSISREELIGKFTQIHSRKTDKVAARKSALPYDSLMAIETPSLLVHKSRLESNLHAMNRRIDSHHESTPLTLRPSASTHKCSELVQLQLKAHRARMNGICCSTISEAESLINSGTNFLSGNSDYKIRDVLLSSICVDLPKMWRFLGLYDSTILGMKLSVTMDDILQLHLWNYSVEEFKRTNQNLLSRHTSSSSDGSLHSSNALRLGLRIVIQCGFGSSESADSQHTDSQRRGIGIDVTTENGRERLNEMMALIEGQYADNVFVRGLIVKGTDESARKWLSEEAVNWKTVNSEQLLMDTEHELVDGDYIFEDGALSILSTVSNVYEDGGRFVHLLDCGANSFYDGDSGLKMSRFHRPSYVLEADQNLEAVVEGGKYEHELKIGGADYSLLIANQELEVGGKVELIPSHFAETVNLYNYLIVVDDDKRMVDGIWTVDARGPGN